VIFNLYSGQPYVVNDVDTVVLVFGREANDQLGRELRGKVRELFEIGDCYTPRRVNNAIYEGFMAAMKI
jgi:hypothetical protein